MDEVVCAAADSYAMGLEQHRKDAPLRLGFAVLTISDTRSGAAGAPPDLGGDFLVASVEGAGHRVVQRARCADEADAIRAALRRWLDDVAIDVILTTGGTGIAPRDVTYPTLKSMFDSEIPGFGELFRALSFQEIGSATILSRATAGLIAERVVIALPGSPKALRLAMERIVLPEAGHLVSQARGSTGR